MGLDQKCEFLFRNHEHVMESIKLFDQKAAAIIAITIGVLYVLSTIIRTPTLICETKFIWLARPALDALIITSLSVGIFQAIQAVYPWSETVEKKIAGGDMSLPNLIGKLTQQELEAKLFESDEKKWLVNLRPYCLLVVKSETSRLNLCIARFGGQELA